MRTKTGVLGMIGRVLKLPIKVTSNVWYTRTKMAALEVRIKRIVFQTARKPTSKERKKERMKERRRERLFFYLIFLPNFFTYFFSDRKFQFQSDVPNGRPIRNGRVPKYPKVTERYPSNPKYTRFRAHISNTLSLR